MAIDEEEVVVEKSKGGGGGLIPLITLVLVVVSIGVSAFSLITVMGMNSAMKEATMEAEKPEMIPGEVSVLEIETYAFTDQFIFTYRDAVDTDVNHNVVVNINIGLHNTEDTADEVATVTTTLTSKETIIRAGLESMLKAKTFDDWDIAENQEALRGEILTYLQERLATTVIIDVYFNNYLTSSR